MLNIGILLYVWMKSRDQSFGERLLQGSLSCYEVQDIWKVHEGCVSMWFDNFMTAGPLHELVEGVEEPYIRVQELIINDSWDVEGLQLLLGVQNASDFFATVGTL